MSTTDQPAESIAEKLEYLFAAVRQPDGSRLTLTMIVTPTRDLTGVKITEGYLLHLRTGRVKSPSFQVVQCLAAAFGADVDYFSPATKRTSISRSLTSADAERTAFRVAGLPQEDSDVINDMITAFRSRRNLPNDPTTR